MTHYRIQHWPHMPGDGSQGDAIIFSSDWPARDWERHKSWTEAWAWLAGNSEPLDQVFVLPPAAGARSDSYGGEQDQWILARIGHAVTNHILVTPGQRLLWSPHTTSVSKTGPAGAPVSGPR